MKAKSKIEEEYNTFKKGEKAGKIAVIPLSNFWKFKTSPSGRGIENSWQNIDYNDKHWSEIKSNASNGWLKQGYPHYYGYGWYRQSFKLKTDFLDRKHVYLLFGGIDKQAEVFINGKKAFTHDHITTVLHPGGTWNRPFFFDAKKYLKKGENMIAVRAYSWCYNAGMHKNALLFSSDITLSNKALCSYLFDKGELDEGAFKKWCFDYIPPEPDPDQHLFGSRIQRTMTLLATSSKTNRQTVKILFYGQSIVLGLHWQKIINKLKAAYPYANIIAENRAIGGYTAPSLVRTAVHDLYPFYPDLVFFHVYDGEQTGELERILYNIRKYTTAEIMMFTHTLRHEKEIERGKQDNYSAQYNRYLAQKYNCEIVESRNAWKRYLKKNNLLNSALLGDNIHLNTWGQMVMIDLIMRHFNYNTLFPGGWYNMVRWYEAKRFQEEKQDEINFTGTLWKKAALGVVGDSPSSALKLKFTGNRVDVISFPYKNIGSAKILIDGKVPSTFPELYTCSRIEQRKRVTPGPEFKGTPMINRITLGDNPVVEDWIIRVKEIKGDKDFTYEVIGSLTGNDGVGNSRETFVSKSGRITIEPQDINILSIFESKKKKLSIGAEGTWKVVPMFIDIWQPEKKSKNGIDDRCTLVQGLENKEHSIEIIPNGEGPVTVKSLIVYSPPLR